MAKTKKTRKKTIKKPATNKPDEKTNTQPVGVTQPAESPVNTEFEQAAAANVTEPKKDNRGGVRPGAGRPLGLTDEKAKVKNLPQYPSIPIRQGCQALFDLWASAAKIEQLALSDEEADLLSLPLTQLQEFYFPGILPEIAGTWIMLIFAATRVVKPRIEIVNQVRQQRRSEKAETVNDVLHFVDVNGQLIHAHDPTKPAKTTIYKSKVTCPECKKILDVSEQN